MDDIAASGGEAVIPARRSRTVPRAIDADRYRDRNLVGRLRSKEKQHRRVATRYDGKAQDFRALPHVASIMILRRPTARVCPHNLASAADRPNANFRYHSAPARGG